MCGIAGIWGDGDIDKMVQIMFHRGPDEDGFYQDDKVRMGIRRLKVIDLKTGSQPIHNEDRTVWVVFNGEIFNFQELRRELEKKHTFHTKSDTEVIVHAYEEWGTDCVKHFNGMFAFCIWDGKRFFLARDRIGEKPLFYALRDGKFYFASEIKAILTQIDSEPVLDDNFWVFDVPVEDSTLFSGIKQLLPAHRMTYDGRKLRIDRYWDLPKEPAGRRKEADCVEELRFLLRDSVRLRMISDVPVGMFLSGGLDSAIIACLAKPERVFTCRFPLGEFYDEFEYAKLVGEKIKARMHVVRPTAADFKASFKKIIWNLEQPIATASSIAEFSLAREAAKHVKVILGGQGSDEAFLGYVRYLLMLIEDQLAQLPEIKNYHSLARFFWSEEMFKDPARRYFNLIKRAEIPGEDKVDLVRKYFGKFRYLLNDVGYCDLNLSLPSLLTMNDRAASAYGLENRCPFLDHRIVEFAFSLPPEMKIREYTTKYILRQAARGIVPRAIIERKDKKGLVVPINLWFGNELKPWVRRLTANVSKRIDLPPSGDRGEFDRSAYSKVSLELWFRNFFTDYYRNDANHALVQRRGSMS